VEIALLFRAVILKIRCIYKLVVFWQLRVVDAASVLLKRLVALAFSDWRKAA
jgi:hypothetical protein